jgi:amino acid adenylation domain-containing protein
MLEDTRAPVVLTQAHLVDVLPRHDAVVIRLDVEDDLVASAPKAADAGKVKPENLVYIIYTSGSTGRPKGVEITHRNLVHSTVARKAAYGEAPQSYLLLSSFGFDSSIVCIFWTLCEGGTLVLPSEGLERDLHEIGNLVAAHGITHTLVLPSLHAVLLRETRGEKLDSLRTVIVAGEACSREIVELHGEFMPGAALFNEYGPTEGTVWSTVHRCRTGRPEARVSIGHPIANVRVYLLDSRMQPVPIGVAGEMCIGGAGIARGYLRRPELTAEKFVADPFMEGERLYRTGDLARYLPDGEIEFLGRADNQVKVRGYRIELEEIEEVLGRAPSVAEVVVAAREEASGDKRLVAYVVGDVESRPVPDALQEFLGARLPEYMVPASIVVLESLPRMPNGKVDRGALPDPDGSAAREDYVAPRNRVEAALARMWEDLVGVDAVGVHDNFFRIGGHSLLVTQLIFRLRQVFQVEIPLRGVFDKPTVAELAEVLLGDARQKERVERAAATLSGEASQQPDVGRGKPT